MVSKRWTAGVAAAALAVVGVASARAEQITVNSFEDRPDADLTDGVCDADLAAAGLQCTLRAAIQHANATPGEDSVTLPTGKYKLKIKGAAEEFAATGDLDITDDIVLVSTSALTTIIDAKKAKDRIFDIKPGVKALIFCMTLKSGKTPRAESGGGVRNNGILDLHDVIITKCKAGDDAGGFDMQSGSATLQHVLITKCSAGDDGGGVDIDGGSFTLDACTISKCKAKFEGGGLENSGQTMTLVNSTLSGNAAKEGGGISLEDGGTISITHCTIALNKAKVGAGISVTDTQFGTNTCTVTNSIFASNTKANSDGPLTSNGGNIDSGTTCGFTGGDDRSTTNPLLGKLLVGAGVPMPVHTPKSGSPAIGFAAANCALLDEVNMPRSTPCDSGAVQTQQATPVGAKASH